MAKIFLIGMPGSGKSTVGKLVAKELNYRFLDLDLEIERKEGATIEAIFELRGEDYFRQVEAQVLSEIVNKEGDFVIATGGGTPCFYNGLKLMQEKGRTIYIKVSPNVLIHRLKTDSQRPLLKKGVEARINELYADRVDVYTKAEVIVEAEHLSKEELVDSIKNYL